VLDTETTGLPESGGRVCEVAVVRFEQGVPVSRFSSLIDPGCPIPAEATAVHKITDADVAGKPSLPDIAHELFRVCDGAVTAAYAASFDRHMIHAQIQGKDCHAFDPEQSWIDVLPLVRHYDRFVSGKGRNKLTAACARRNIIVEGAHRAMADAMACGFLLHRFQQRLGNPSAAQLIARCDARRVEQDAEFQKWLARQPKKEAV
jgi:DNA polymerase III epsilon subunit-like protein